MAQYRITATTPTATRTNTFDADDSTDATVTGIRIILDKAIREPAGPWGRGRITLTDLTTGTVLQTMDAKG